MPPGSQEDGAASMEAAGCEDRISALPDEVIHHLLGLLPAPEAVRTSLLARGCRHHWRSMRSLRFTVSDGPALTAEWLNRFMSRLLRGPLDVCDIYVEFGQCDDVAALESNRWVRQAVCRHHARELIVDLELNCDMPSFFLAGKPLASRHLARLELCYVLFCDRILDFARCSALEDLMLFACDIGAKKISSPSLKRLRINPCNFCKRGSRTCISAPNLVSLKLEHLVGTSPVLESMPLLEAAVVRLDFCNHHYNDDYPCEKGDDSRECCGLCDGCVASDDHSGGGMLLQGLASATRLELMVPFAKVNMYTHFNYNGLFALNYILVVSLFQIYSWLL